MTYLTSAEVKHIVHLSGAHIRLFLGNANPDDFTGESKNAIAAFHRGPGEFSDERMLEKGADAGTAHQHAVRIELRGAHPQGAAQVAAKGIWGLAREKTIAVLRAELEQRNSAITVRTAGSSSFEFNRSGVDKSLPLRYIDARWDEILNQMVYVPGPFIDSRLDRAVIAADGDGTIYDGPALTHLPALKDGPVRTPLTRYLKAGGVFMLVSGNDLTRAWRRLLDGLPPDIYPRLLIAANGGADLARIGKDGRAEFIHDYRSKALEIAAGPKNKNALDIVYIGDDPGPDGNDRPAFEAVGQQRAVVVKDLNDTKLFLEQWMHERKIHSA
ncbi:MAG: hypothetical protein HY591_01220 [Candidatus Omnitrophica bacterium]|nr:hypothetical protein [Candidatus Omnitrophota bacterium]